MISLNATLIVQILNFLVLVWALKYVLFKPVFNMLDKREQYKKTILGEIERVERETAETAKRYESMIHSAQTEALQRTALILKNAGKEYKDILEVARLESYGIISTLENKLRVETERIRQALRKEMEQWAHDIASKILGKGF
jgi:F-type H+-transporting ATPase subunit b